MLDWYDYLFYRKQNQFATKNHVRIFVMGSNCWRDEEDWPLPRAKETAYYLHSSGDANSLNGGGSLSTTKAASERPDTYFYDPTNPAPTLGGPLCCDPNHIPAGPRVLRLEQYHRHARMNRRREFIGVGSDNAERLQPFPSWVLPRVPEPCECQGFVILQPESKGLLRFRIQFFPFVIAACRHKTPAFLERRAPGRALFYVLGLGVDGRYALYVRELLSEEGNQALSHRRQLAVPRLFVVTNNRLESGGCHVIVRVRNNERGTSRRATK